MTTCHRPCEHYACRQLRAAQGPRRYGRSPEFATEHRRAAALQHRHPGLIVWFGEGSQRYRAMTTAGLHESADIDHLLLAVWPHIRPHPIRAPHREIPLPGR